MNRVWLTVVTGVCLFCTYRVYAEWIDRLTVMEAEPTRVVDLGARDPLPESVLEVAREVLPGEDWGESPPLVFQRDEEVFIYTGKVEIVDDSLGNRVQFSPFALVWSDPADPDAEPYVIRGRTARVKFENPVRLEFGSENPGRLIAAAIDGPVVVSGPNGLSIEGENFVFSEQAGHLDSSPGDQPDGDYGAYLYSDYHVAFAYGPAEGEKDSVHGSAEGIQIDFTPSYEPVLGKDMPRVSGVERMRLRRDVVLNLTYEEKDDKGNLKTGRARVTCDGGVVYDVAAQIARFEENVFVERPTGSPDQTPESDQLSCDWLELFFEKEAEVIVSGDGEGSAEVQLASATSEDRDELQNPFEGMRFSRLRAIGDKAALQSDEHRLVANMNELHYQAATGTAVLLDQEAVRVQRDDTKLMSPRITVLRGTDKSERSLVCEGDGRLEQSDPDDGSPVLQASWKELLRVANDAQTGLTVVQVSGTARVIQPERQGMLADRITLWLDAEPAGRRSGEPNALIDSLDPDALDALPLKFALAQGNVTMEGPQFYLETSRLKASFEEGAVAESSRGGSGFGLQDRDQTPQARDNPWIVQARSVDVRIVQDPRNSAMNVAEATAEGSVLLTRQDLPDPNREGEASPVAVSGSRMHLINRGGADQVLHLTGSPAKLRRGEYELEGSDLRLDRFNNLATVVGKGMLQFPVASNLMSGSTAGQDGNSNQISLMDVLWQEGMTFDGTTAKFLREVQLRLDESRLWCEEMDVHIDRKIDFSDSEPVSEQPQLTQVSCRDGVRLEFYDWDGTRLTGIRKATLAEFTFDHQTGEFAGLGPGVVNDWTLGGQRRISIAPKAVAQANQPADSDRMKWDYTNVEFVEKITGNAQHRLIELHGRVRAIYAPVENVNETFQRKDLSGNAANADDAVWLGCDKLSVILHPRTVGAEEETDETAEEDKYYAVMRGSGHCELEGKVFRAVADTLSYDQAKELFILKGLGKREASIYLQENPGDDPKRLPSQEIRFIPSQKHVNLERSSGIQGVQ